MDHRDHLELIRDGVCAGPVTWAEFGSGTGHFTLALADLLGPQARIYSVDIDASALRQQEARLRKRFARQPAPSVAYITGDYTQPLELPPLDGILMANVLHFQKRKETLLESLIRYLNPGGRLLLVEYNTDRGNHWVPYPLSYPSWQALATRAGLTGIRLLKRVPSSFLGEFYSAVSFKP